ncbi:MAG: hypothetical protein AMXMBFR47_28220 [Planctomycetota bacterium]
MASATEPPTLDCQTCGACCAEFDVLLTGAEVEEFEADPHFLELTILYPPQQWRFMRRDEVTGRCVALEGPLSKNRCTIYERRPFLCRDFAAGSRQCHEARQKVLGIAIPASALGDDEAQPGGAGGVSR